MHLYPQIDIQYEYIDSRNHINQIKGEASFCEEELVESFLYTSGMFSKWNISG